MFETAAVAEEHAMAGAHEVLDEGLADRSGADDADLHDHAFREVG
ncbi:hypothetical protein O0S08_42040 [Nannocystis poenicansa]|uniref:Uncharacterized protein n=1 Tax=Nannocystis punicea TaxID=2995304 RepID=A0ABY7H0M2_9BACT|nr:hypothetical protein [Nannocystis poenicansa]WAS92801.1 hypothetical protein O0S08_42040 [Nannocystis poenicansa]